MTNRSSSARPIPRRIGVPRRLTLRTRNATSHGDTMRRARTQGDVAERYLRAFVVGIPLAYAVLLMLAWHRVGTRDFDQFLVFHELQDWNHQLFGLAKQWTPVLCSGLSLGGEPQVPFLSLSMLLGYVFGVLPGLDLAVPCYLAWGWIGAYLYAGLCTSVRSQRWLAASLFIGNGFFVCRIGYGHIDFVPFLTLPFML